MFKKKSPKPDDLTVRRDDLQARLSAAEDRLEALRADAVNAASSDPDKLAGLSEPASRVEFSVRDRGAGDDPLPACRPARGRRIEPPV